MGKQISDWRAGFGKKTFRYGMTFRIWKKKIVSLSYFLFVGSCFKERNRFGADFFQKNFSFCRKRVPEGQFPSPRMTFPFKGRPIDFVFFFSGINGKKLLAFPQENRATISAFLLRNFPLRIWKDRSLILFLDDALDYLQFPDRCKQVQSMCLGSQNYLFFADTNSFWQFSMEQKTMHRVAVPQSDPPPILRIHSISALQDGSIVFTDRLGG